MADHLIDHRYTVLEIDRMRRAIYKLGNLSARKFGGPGIFYESVAEQRAAMAEEGSRVEDEVRTYMLAGIRPEELEDRAEKAHAEFQERMSALRTALGA